jgi:hypothetical protein
MKNDRDLETGRWGLEEDVLDVFSGVRDRKARGCWVEQAHV